jgi:hypothetical protein
MSEAKMRLICEYPQGTLRNATTVNNIAIVGQTVKTLPGIGQPFLVFSSLPGVVGAVDWQHESIVDENGNPKYIVSSVTSENVQMINAMLANPPLGAITLPA